MTDRPTTEPRHAPAIGLSSAGRHTLCMGCGEPWPCRSAEAAQGAAPRPEECTTPKWCAENGCQHRMTLVEALRAESRLGEDGYWLVPLDDAIRAVNAAAVEAIEWARQLVEQGYRDEHIVTFTDDGYGLEHPIRCRPNLTGCILNEWLRTQMAPDREPGRYVMEWAEDGPTYSEAEDD